MELSGLRVNDIVVLKDESATMLYDGQQFHKENYQEIHQKNLTGKIVSLCLQNNHYCYGEYAIVKWQNNFVSDNIHTSWLRLSQPLVSSA